MSVYFRHLFDGQCIESARRKYIYISYRSLRVEIVNRCGFPELTGLHKKGSLLVIGVEGLGKLV